jgi:nucleoside-diphosphate-sugar epimerase
VAIFCGRILANRALTVFGDGTQTRDYVYVGDVARAVWMAATKPLPDKARLDARAFNIGTGVGTPVLEMAERLEKAAGGDVPIEFAPHRPGEQQDLPTTSTRRKQSSARKSAGQRAVKIQVVRRAIRGEGLTGILYRRSVRRFPPMELVTTHRRDAIVLAILAVFR